MNKFILLLLLLVSSIADAGQIKLYWSQVLNCPTPSVGTQISCGTTSGVYNLKQDAGKSNSIIISKLTPGVTYYCMARGYSANEAEYSDPSIESPFVAYNSVEYSIMDLQHPTVLSIRDGAVELGMAFTPIMDGKVTGVKFYKSPLETGAHTGTLWNATTKQKLGSVTFTNECSEGWQMAHFTTPINVLKNTVYVISVNSNVYHSMTRYGFNTYINNGGLKTTLVNGVNGFFGNRTTFPSGTYQNTNYFVDTLFTEN